MVSLVSLDKQHIKHRISSDAKQSHIKRNQHFSRPTSHSVRLFKVTELPVYFYIRMTHSHCPIRPIHSQPPDNGWRPGAQGPPPRCTGPLELAKFHAPSALPFRQTPVELTWWTRGDLRVSTSPGSISSIIHARAKATPQARLYSRPQALMLAIRRIHSSQCLPPPPQTQPSRRIQVRERPPAPWQLEPPRNVS